MNAEAIRRVYDVVGAITADIDVLNDKMIIFPETVEKYGPIPTVKAMLL